MSSSEDRRRYLIIGSVIIEVVQPLLRKKLESLYQQNFGTFEDFLNSQPVKHILFHLRHKNNWCCQDQQRCTNGRLPLYHSQWDLLYTENPGQAGHNCHCKYRAKPVLIDELDINLSSLVLLNCCPLSPADENAIHKLRQFKNELLSHNTTGGIKQTEYDSHWGDIMSYVLQLDPTKQDDMIRLENRPLDDMLCTKYFIQLLGIYEIINKMGISLQQIHDTLQGNFAVLNRHETLLQDILAHLKSTRAVAEQPKDRESILQMVPAELKLGEKLFRYTKTIPLPELDIIHRTILLDDGRVVCLVKKGLIIFYIHDGHREDVRLQCYGGPSDMTFLKDSTVAVLWRKSRRYTVQIYDVNTNFTIGELHVDVLNNYLKCITEMSGNLVVGCFGEIKIINSPTGEVLETIHTGLTEPLAMKALGDKIFFINCNHFFEDKHLSCYDTTKKTMSKIKLPNHPNDMTFLPDGSLYVIGKGVVHVSNDLKKYQRAELGPSDLDGCSSCCYNKHQRKMVVVRYDGLFVFDEKKCERILKNVNILYSF